MIKDYYALAKPGIIYGNVITVIAGFAVASRAWVLAHGAGHAAIVDFNFPLLVTTIIGLALVIGGGGAFNNVIDRDIDARMERTKNREMVAGRVSRRAAIIYGAILDAAGFAVLWFFTNPLTIAVAATGVFSYVIVYSLWAKRATVHGAVIGSIAGAVPPVIGYCAVSDRLDAGAVLLFFILVLWQIPHFYAIGIYRADDYAAADIPILPVVRGFRAAKINMFFYILAFTGAAAELFAYGYLGFGGAGYVYAAAALILGFSWLWLCVQGFFIGTVDEDKQWARKMFFLSLLVLVLLFATMTITALV
jgi:protoheme IX farnesyltransferase